MDGELEDFSVECLDELEEIELEYEFDAAWFYDFCRPETFSEAAEAERWFETAGNYPPSPLIVKLNLVKEAAAECSRDPSRLREMQTTISSSNASNIHIGSSISPYKPKTEETLSVGRMAKEIPKAKLKSEPRGSTLMKPTASHLAKLRSQNPPSKIDERSSWNSSVSYNAATKRQKLESGYLRKVTVPRDPQLETMQRAQRRRSKNDSEASDHAKAKGQPSKAQPLNTKILKAPVLSPHPKTTLRLPEFHVFKLKTMVRASRNSSANVGHYCLVYLLSNSQNAKSAAHCTSVDFKRPNSQNAVKQGNSVTLLKSKALRCNKIFPSSEDTRICKKIGERSTPSMNSKSTVDKRLPVHPPVDLFNKRCIRKPNQRGKERAHHGLEYQSSMKDEYSDSANCITNYKFSTAAKEEHIMPSVVVCDETMTTTDVSKDLKKKIKKEKKSKIDCGSDSEDIKKSKKKEKKRKALDLDDEEKSDTTSSSEICEPIDTKKNKKAKLMEEEEEAVVVEEKKVEEDPNLLSNFRMSKPLRDALNAKGIQALFPIQAMTFNDILDGSDLVGRARTGQGKTLAFVLPILESLTNGPTKDSRKTGYGKAPSVLVLLPTRELALQVFADFEVYGRVVGLTSCCLYGNSPMGAQTAQLKRGVDIVVGTPGRVKDHIERGNIDFRSLKFRVLDEVDEMLKIGFVDDVELILGKVEDASQVQTVLFSATLPVWVKHIASKFLKPDKKTVDLVGNEKMKASKNVRHIIIPCSSGARPQLIPDIIRCYSSGGRTIIFTETRALASELAGILPGASALHGEIQQNQREATLKGFRSGKFMTLVATNVAARGLDIDDVQLIIQCEATSDVEAYIHRSGRTGRAGKTGVAVMLYDPRKSNISRIERESGVKFEHLSAPQPADVAKAAGKEAADIIADISDSVIPAFKAAAEELLNTSDLSPAELLAKALAKAAGYSEIKTRSLLTSMENCVTLLLECGRPIFSPSFVYSVLRRFLPEEKVESINGLTLTADGKGAVFDVSAEHLDEFLAGHKSAHGVNLEVVEVLPPLQERENPRGRFGGGGRGGGFRRGGGGFSGGRGRDAIQGFLDGKFVYHKQNLDLYLYVQTEGNQIIVIVDICVLTAQLRWSEVGEATFLDIRHARVQERPPMPREDDNPA
ncbi:hypothetical protein RND71_023855 [Anisodus tanguticus]|uniref:RNA helicase n=1 Tax=Anisodus tanguticus TaxID=243964 RepID=A0AAE1RV65_9SOLA|nr:hypothetical protein RND71_023855 [Anisodus tanguticus]